MVQYRIDICSQNQLQPDMGTSRCVLTVNNESRHVSSVTYGAVEWFDFEDVEWVCPMDVSPLGRRAVLMEDDQVGRKAGFVHYPTLNFHRVVDVIALRNSRREVWETR